MLKRLFNINLNKIDRPKLFLLLYLTIYVIYTLWPPKQMPIMYPIEHQLAGRVTRVIGTIHSTWIDGFFIRLNSEELSIRIECKIKEIVKNGEVIERIYFSNIVKKGDSIFKRKDSDTLYLYRDNKLIYQCRLEL